MTRSDIQLHEPTFKHHTEHQKPMISCNKTGAWLEALAPVTVIQCTELPLACCNHVFRCWKPLPMQLGLHRREQKEVTQVPDLDCKEDGLTAAQESPSENPLSNGWHGQQDAPQSSSWVLFSQFLGNLWEGSCGVPLYSHCRLLLKWYCCHMTTCSKESEHHFLPNTFCSFHFDRSIIIREPQTDEWRFVSGSLVNPGLITCNDLRIGARVPIVESPKHSTAPFHSSDLLTVSETVWHPARWHLADPKIDVQNFCNTPRSNPWGCLNALISHTGILSHHLLYSIDVVFSPCRQRSPTPLFIFKRGSANQLKTVAREGARSPKACVSLSSDCAWFKLFLK